MTGHPRHIALVAGLVPLLAAGCVDYDLTRYQGVDLFNQNPAEEVDVLMVVDNSGSMQPYQTRLGTNFDQFITYFIEANVDYHIGVVTTDVEAAGAGVIRGDVITPETENGAEVFNSIVNVGTTGSGYEMGLEAAYRGLSEPLISTTNMGFLREEASLSLIFVSDEEDASPYPVARYINNFRDIKGQRARDVFNASALVVTDKTECGVAEQYSVEGTRYIDVAEQTRGITGNLCAADFADIVTDLSLNASRLNDTYYLSDWPAVASLQVTVDEVELPCEDGSWTYQILQLEGLDNPAIVFERTAMPDVGARITVRYDYGEGDPANFCGAGSADDTDEPADTGSEE